jgi:N-acetylmuramoyl-L-alanine amidase
LALAWLSLLLPADALAQGCAPGRLRVAIDIGHSRVASGATSATGKQEYYFNKRFAYELVDRAKTSPDVDLFLLMGNNLSLLDRPYQAAKRGADLLLSIHHDSVHKKYRRYWQHEGRWLEYTDVFKGYSLFVWERGAHLEDSIGIATLIGANLKEAGFPATLHHAEPIEGENRALLNRELGVYAAPFAVLRYATIPAVLFEVGVIANRSEEKELENAQVRAKIQRQVVSALEEFCSRRTSRRKRALP